MSLNVNNLIKAIDDMTIYKYDYDVISKLLASGDNKLFTKILEEVVNGELTWADFDEYLSNTDFPDVFLSNLETQEKLEKKLKLLIDFRKHINPDYVYTDEDNSILMRGVANDDGVFYNLELAKIKQNLLFKVLSVNSKDNEITIAMKNALYNAIRNNEIYMNNPNDYTIEDGSIVITENGVVNKYDYLNYEDLLLYLDNAIIPLNYEDQQLDEYDKEYMIKNNLSESQMKQFKSLSILFRKGLSELNSSNSNNGGE